MCIAKAVSEALIDAFFVDEALVITCSVVERGIAKDVIDDALVDDVKLFGTAADGFA